MHETTTVTVSVLWQIIKSVSILKPFIVVLNHLIPDVNQNGFFCDDGSELQVDVHIS